MVSQEADTGLSDTNRETFVRELQELKEYGSSLLVVGDVPDAAAVKACHWMLGDETVQDRRRLFVSTSPDLPDISERLSTSPDRLHPETTKLVTWTAKSRSATTASPVRPPQLPYEGVDPSHVESDKLAELGIAISREIEAFEEIAGELSPSELRVCFDSLTALSAEYDQQKVLQFLHILIGRIQSVRGMAHFHFPVEYDSKHVKQFAPLFDATVELQIADGQPEQRWHLREADITSGWLTPPGS
ncbi:MULTISPECIES: DUF7504 family protein [Halorussus]|uniref:Uncharacterized protein n=2 Tax=Halorussus TaxID=1070314 RepID=A0A8U0I2Q8_9EURY|nr:MULTISPECIES: hypothetical protein [Halorussus]UPV77196.1 hypothetical protein M0R89_22760 [Halorussus limi]